MPGNVAHFISAQRQASLIEHLVEYFDRHVEVLIKEGVPPDRIAEALKLTTIRVVILDAGAMEIGEKARVPDSLPGHPPRPDQPECGDVGREEHQGRSISPRS